MTYREVQLQDVLDIQWGDTKTTKASYVPEGFIAYSASGPDGFLEKYDYEHDAVVLSAIGANCGTTFYATGKWSCIKNTIRIFPKSDDIDLKYFYYMTKSPDFWPLRGSAQPFISQTDIREKVVKIPEIAAQWQIGQILFDIENKIQANSVLAETLEGIAQTVFKSWFIDFDPVKAKMAGEMPEGMDAEITALFPSSLVESEIGLIPEGWSVNPIGDALEVAGGATPSTKNSAFWGGEFTWTTPKDLSIQEGLITTGSARTLTREGLAKVSSGLLPVNSVVMSCRAPIGYLSINAVPTAVNQGCITLRNSTNFSPLFVLNWLRANMQEVLNRAGGGTFAEISRKSFKEIPMLLPSQAISDAYSAIANPILAQLENLTRENETLVAIRDSMLPRLISGELQIPEEILAS